MDRPMTAVERSYQSYWKSSSSYLQSFGRRSRLYLSIHVLVRRGKLISLAIPFSTSRSNIDVPFLDPRPHSQSQATQ